MNVEEITEGKLVFLHFSIRKNKNKKVLPEKSILCGAKESRYFSFLVEIFLCNSFPF